MGGKEGTGGDDDGDRVGRSTNDATTASSGVPPSPTTTRPGTHVKLSASQQLALAAHDGLLNFNSAEDGNGTKGPKLPTDAGLKGMPRQQPSDGGGGGGGGGGAGASGSGNNNNTNTLSTRPYAAFERADTEGGMVAGGGFFIGGSSSDGLDTRDRDAALDRRRAEEDATRRKLLNDTTLGAVVSSTGIVVSSASDLTEVDLESYEGFDRIGAAVTGAVGNATKTIADTAAAATRVAGDSAVVAAADAALAPVDAFGASLRDAVAEVLPTDRRSLERSIDRGVDAVRAAAHRWGVSDYPFTTMAVFSLLSLTVLANVNLLKGGESPMGWRPGDMLPKRLRYRNDWKAGAEFGGEGSDRLNMNMLRGGSGFKTHDKLRSYMHPTELAQYGISVEGHKLADRPLLEINDDIVNRWTTPPPPPSDAEKYATERNNLPRGFDKWDEHHKKLWLDSKRQHQEELRAAEVKKIAALAEKNEVSLKSDPEHHKVLREHALTHAKDKIESMVQGVGFSKDVYLEELDQDLIGEKVPQITYKARKPGQLEGKDIVVG